VKPFLLRGALAGIAGSVASVLVLLLLGETYINRAIELEEANVVAGEAHEELFSRGVQVFGGALGLVVYGVCVGLVFGILFAAVRHRLGADAEWRRARRLGALAFGAVFLIPFLKYPGNPPAVGDPETVSQRTLAYVSMVVLSILAVVLAAVVLDRLRHRGVAEVRAQPLAALVWLAVVVIGMVALPPNPDPIAIPADLLWSFRVSSIAGQAALWAVTSTVFGLLTVRAATNRDEAVADGSSSVPGSASPLA
jgi:predicted cobalt transporter CbtA